MNRKALAFIVALLTLLCAGDISVSYLNHGMFPEAGNFGTLRPIDAAHAVFTAVNPAGRALGLRRGDVRDLRLWTPEQRMDLFYGYAWGGTTFDLPYVRSGTPFTVRVSAVREQGRAAGDAVDVALRLMLALAGILLIARGTDRASMLAGLFVCSISVYEGFTNAYTGPPAVAVAASIVANTLGGIFGYIARFLFALELMPARAPRALRIGLAIGFIAVGLPFYVSLVERAFITPVFGLAPPALQSIPYFPLQFALGILILCTFAVAAAYAEGANASAVRFIFAVLAVSFIGAAGNYTAVIMGQPYPLHGSLNLTYLALALALPYAVLAKRLVAVDFVLSKALVYAIVLTLIVSAFVLAEHVIEAAALGRLQSYALELVVPLVLGFSIQWIERWTERVVERVLYRDRLRAEQALQALAEDFPYARDVGVLAGRAATEVHRSMRSPFVCIYRETETTYSPIALAGLGEALPVDADDPVFLRIRAKHSPLQTEDFSTVLPPRGAVFPLVVFGKVTGAIYAHYRESGERFDPDESEMLRKLAHELAIALLWVERSDTALMPSAEAKR
jgi:hypothetical protein